MSKAMIKRLLRNGSDFFYQRQNSILSAAVIIMVMVAISRFLGLIRNRILAHYFSVESLSVYFAAFRLPETVFEVLIFGALSSAFIPTFTSYFSKDKRQEAWHVAAVSLNIALLCFLVVAAVFFVFTRPIYQLIAPGFNPGQLDLVTGLARVLLFAQVFFVMSYFLTGVLESLQRFLVPAIAPLFYNLGIILGAIFLTGKYGIYAPAIGAVIGAFLHFLIQLPVAYRLGFKLKASLDFSHPGVREIGRLALPRIVELSFLQLGKSAELFFASLVSAAAYTYYTFANSLQLLPIGLFGISIAKASLPTLSYQSANGDIAKFKEIFISLFNEIVFLTIPFSIFLAVLRIPLVRLVFGASRFTWESTVQTGYTVSAFCLGIFAQALIYLLTRSFYAFHDTKTPVKISIVSILINIFLGTIFILSLKLPIWSLALAFSFTSIVQASILLVFLYRQYIKFQIREIAIPFAKIILASLASGGLMFFFLKVLDRSVWDKRLSFLGQYGLGLPVSFDRFVLDTRYTLNLIIITAVVGLIGLVVFIVLAKLLKVEEVAVFRKFITRFRLSRGVGSQIASEEEPITIVPE